MKSTVSLHELLDPFPLAFIKSQLTHPIFTPRSPASFSTALCKVPKTREAQFTLRAPSLPPQNPCLPPPTITPKNHTEGCCMLRLGGQADSGWEEIRGEDGRKGGRLLSVCWLCLLMKVYTTLEKLIIQSSPSLFSKCAHQSMTWRSFLELLLIISAS